MDDILKRNIRKTVLFMLATVFVPLLCLPLALIPDLDRSSDSNWIVLLAVAELVYILGCVFVLVWGSSRVIWKLPFGKVWRKVLFFRLADHLSGLLLVLGVFVDCMFEYIDQLILILCGPSLSGHMNTVARGSA